MSENDTPATLTEALAIATRLTPADKFRLIEQLAAALRKELEAPRAGSERSLLELWADEPSNPPEETRKAFSNFPRENA